ncbi:endonuclease NucS domain-containing protein [Mariprofundus ferrooxydans]|uniref:endonuclease NucS domain-containing protein n=1 Tax=Mariprofundus ferrooxydans TaxID=314344 RepID=UPI001430050B|nr:endonuclease NucS domain-containing protein [Mariprofundus ferrooxydans]
MAIEHAMWKVGATPERLQPSMLESEKTLEDMINSDISILNDRWMIIGRQVNTSYGGYIDLLAMDSDGSLILIELKKHKTPREVVAQTIDYASWVKKLQPEKIADIYSKYSDGGSLDDAYTKKFGSKLEEDDLNQTHQMLVVASELDPSTERIVTYLSDMDIPINVLFFKVFKDGDNTYLSRIWMIDPGETQEKASSNTGNKEPWNGEFYVSFGNCESRNWEEARNFGFVSGGGGNWYSKTLFMLNEGDRIWVNVPKTEYVGVGTVSGSAVPLNDFEVDVDGVKTKFIEVAKADYHKQFIDDKENCEYMVPVKWDVEVPLKDAVSEVGFFGNQNTVARPTTTKWPHTVERLKQRWNIE